MAVPWLLNGRMYSRPEAWGTPVFGRGERQARVITLTELSNCQPEDGATSKSGNGISGPVSCSSLPTFLFVVLGFVLVLRRNL